MKNKGFGHLKTRLFTIKTSKNIGFGGPWWLVVEPTNPFEEYVRNTNWIMKLEGSG